MRKLIGSLAIGLTAVAIAFGAGMVGTEDTTMAAKSAACACACNGDQSKCDCGSECATDCADGCSQCGDCCATAAGACCK